MFKKLMVAVCVGAGALAMAVPAGAAKPKPAPTQKSATLTAWPDGTTVEATATASYDATTERMSGSIHIDAGALPPGNYGYWVGSENIETPVGLLSGTSGLICKFTVTKHEHAAGCSGWFQDQYGWGQTNDVAVYERGGGYPPLAGWL
jgi:hypothetical protein